MLKLINYFFLAYILIKPGLGFLFYSIDGAGRISILLGILILLLNINNIEFRKVLKSAPVLIWGLWGVYTAVNWLFHRVETVQVPWIFIGNQIFLVWIAMVVVTYECRRNYQTTLKFILSCFVIYVIFGLLFQRDTIYQSGRGGAVLGNVLPLTSLSMVATAVFMYVKKWLTLKNLVIIIILSLAAILFVATRKALGGLLILLFFLLITKYPLNNVKNFLSLIFGLLVFYVGLSFMLDNTILGERMHGIDESANQFNTSNLRILNFLGDRAYFYIKGWEIFKEHPLTGIGINNFMYIDKLKLPFHTEYMTQLAENGIIGTILYVSFYCNIFKQIIRARKYHIISNEYWPYLGWMFAVLFISLTAWVYSFVHYYIVFGLVIGGIQKSLIDYEKNSTYNQWNRRRW